MNQTKKETNFLIRRLIVKFSIYFKQFKDHMKLFSPNRKKRECKCSLFRNI
jgi:hypothetical protein